MLVTWHCTFVGVHNAALCDCLLDLLMHQLGTILLIRSRAQQCYPQDHIRYSVQDHACPLILHNICVNHLCLCLCRCAKHPLPLQLAGLYLGKNSLQGPLPDSWSECRHVSHCHKSICWYFAVLRGLERGLEQTRCIRKHLDRFLMQCSIEAGLMIMLHLFEVLKVGCWCSCKV